MAWDASRQNEKRSSRVYKDLNLNFSTNPVTQDVTTVTDVNAVKRSVRNLLLTNHYDRPFHPEIGSNVPALLFENFGPITGNQLSRSIEEMIANFEPRARLVAVRATPDLDKNAYDITVEFYVVNAPTELVDLTVMLERLR